MSTFLRFNFEFLNLRVIMEILIWVSFSNVRKDRIRQHGSEPHNSNNAYKNINSCDHHHRGSN